MRPRTCYEAGRLVGSTLYTIILPDIPVFLAVITPVVPVIAAINALSGSTGTQADCKDEEHRDTNHQV